MRNPTCPKCESTSIIKSGIVNNRQRFKCKKCTYNFTVSKLGKEIDPYFVIKALQLYLEGISYREIERILGVSHVSVMNWVKKYKIKTPERYDYHPTYKILSHNELAEVMASPGYLKGSGMLITELGDKFMVIKWDRFKD
ncbi:MAG: helix-turn-helix domain-containing protein [Fulvivirga sp.]|uniref:IS1/IS1595 family N-terminal zinc-binding domain-containing protein n=1 Tax=Fulvivirga sp. TaxID=1931237 RepID=UPI0032ED61B1